MESTDFVERNGHQVSGKNITVAALITAPRYCSTWAMLRICSALNAAGVPLADSGGVYYGQCMQILLEGLVDRGVEYALTVDFDSVFTADHVRRILSIIAQEDDIDALCAVQPMRGTGRILGTTGRQEEVVWSGYPVKVISAHFGLTAIDLKKLARVPKPWLMHIPDPDNSWGDLRVDDDVYFWQQWTKAGNSIYMDPGTRLGHMQEVVTIYNQRMEIEHWYQKQWTAQKTETVDYTHDKATASVEASQCRASA